MTTSSLLFCDECGAGNELLREYCFACQQKLPAVTFSQQTQVEESTPISLPRSMTQTPYPPSPTTLLGGRYRLLKQIGQGGFSVVYKARDTKRWQKTVAIKQIHLGGFNTRQVIDANNAYYRELSILTKLKHRNLPRLHAQFADRDSWYLVLDFIKGETLDAYFTRAKARSLPIGEVINIGVTLCDVLNYLHSHYPPIIFRDIKPDNIMRTSRGKLYLIDFGIARFFSSKQKKDTQPLGSPGYAAPEQYGLAQTTPRSDIYSLGVTLSTLLTGNDPASETDEASVSKPLPQKIPYRLQRLLTQMTETDAEKRPKNIIEVRNTLLLVRPTPRYLLLRITQSRHSRKYLKGFFFGALPFLPWSLILFASSPWLAPLFNTIGILFLFLLCFGWPLYAGIDGIFALLFLCSKNQRWLGLGMLTAILLFITIMLLTKIPFYLFTIPG